MGLYDAAINVRGASTAFMFVEAKTMDQSAFEVTRVLRMALKLQSTSGLFGGQLDVIQRIEGLHISGYEAI